MADKALVKSSEEFVRLLMARLDHFFQIDIHNAIWTSEKDHQWWKKHNCPLLGGRGHLINSQLLFGLGKKSWKCEYCGEYEFLEFEDEET
jgi:hypothetical protein